jgi:hypothetical protein
MNCGCIPLCPDTTERCARGCERICRRIANHKVGIIWHRPPNWYAIAIVFCLGVLAGVGLYWSTV